MNRRQEGINKLFNILLHARHKLNVKNALKKNS